MRLVLAFVGLLLLQAAPPVEPGWTLLWNGKDWTGWKVANPASFKIENGAIVANGDPGHAFYDGPFMNHAFRNFELKVDVMTKPGSNGGIFILTEYQDKGWPAKGFEVQVNNSFAKDPVRTGSLYHVKDVTTPPAKDDEWFTEHITVKGDAITIRVGDNEIVNWTQPAEWKGSPDFADRRLNAIGGTIALQAHDPGSTVYYRNIRIREIR